jgi:hypothetical protein
MLNAAESNYSTTQKELLAVVFSVLYLGGNSELLPIMPLLSGLALSRTIIVPV